jgi:GNAT superfamily N-acetyltransferase
MPTDRATDTGCYRLESPRCDQDWQAYHAAALRLVAIDPAFQGGGHGRVMLERAEQFVRGLGCRKAVVYATPEAAGFYQTAGYDEEDWDEVCMGGIVQMLKMLD